MVSAVSNNQGGGNATAHSAPNGNTEAQSKSGGSDFVIWNGPRLFDPSALKQDFLNAGGSVETLLKSPQIWLLIGEGMMDTSMFDANSAPDFASAIYYDKINAGFVAGLNQFLSGFLSSLYSQNPTSDMKALIDGFCQIYPFASYGHFANPAAGTSSGSGSTSSSNSGGTTTSTNNQGRGETSSRTV